MKGIFLAIFLSGVLYAHAGAARDPDRALRTAMAAGGNTGDLMGTLQSDDYKSHMHNLCDMNSTASMVFPPCAADPGGINPRKFDGDYTIGYTKNSGGNETRPVNASVNYIIKY